MKTNHIDTLGQDPALQVRRRMASRGKRRIVKGVLARNARWRRRVVGSMAAGLAALLGGLLVLGEAAAMVA